MKKISATILLALMLMFAATMAFAAAEAATEAPKPTDAAHLQFYAYVELACAIGIGIAAAGAGAGMGHAVSGAVQGIARNPQTMGKIMTTMILGLALIESQVIYTLVIIFIFLYNNPFKII